MADEMIQKYADMFNLQVAAEAFLNGGRTVEEIRADLAQGNLNNSKLPTTLIASMFGDPVNNIVGRYQLVAHQDLTLNSTHTIDGVLDKSGFSGSIFYDKVENKYVFSMRSTEFGENIRDSGDVNAGLEIGFESGWAFGQIASMEKFWASLLNGSATRNLD